LFTSVGVFAAHMLAFHDALLIPPLRKGEVVWRCLYVLSLYSASPQRAAVSNKHVAQFSHHICWGLRGKHVRVRRNPPQSPFTKGGSDLVLSVSAVYCLLTRYELGSFCDALMISAFLRRSKSSHAAHSPPFLKGGQGGFPAGYSVNLSNHSFSFPQHLIIRKPN